MTDYTMMWAILILDDGYRTGHYKALGFHEKARAIYLHKTKKKAVYLGTNRLGERKITCTPG